ncbi:hypothetical protein L218DRAFT_990829 [Marasmius fiardii PR-910]|nr:hypothetical protein L218DRAFT_990829 [Marasmius fiardii PR-910]
MTVRPSPPPQFNNKWPLTGPWAELASILAHPHSQISSQSSSLPPSSTATVVVQGPSIGHSAIIGLAIGVAIVSMLLAAGGILLWIRCRKKRALSPSEDYRRQNHGLTPYMTPAYTIPGFTERFRTEKRPESPTHRSGQESRSSRNPQFDVPNPYREVLQHEDSGWRPAPSEHEPVELPPTYDDSTRPS